MSRSSSMLPSGSASVSARRWDRHRAADAVHAHWLAGEAVVLALVVALALLIRNHSGPLPGDIGLERGEQDLLLPHGALTNLLEAISTIGWPIPAAVTLGTVIVAFLLLRRWLDAIVAVVCAVVTDEATFLLSKIVHRPRPRGHGIHILQVINSTYSFPSGHVVHVTAVFGLLIFLTFQIKTRIPDAVLWVIRVLLLLFIVSMGPSRILEGEHWPSDVLTGYLWGLFWMILAAHGYLWARHRFPRLLARDEQ